MIAAIPTDPVIQPVADLFQKRGASITISGLSHDYVTSGAKLSALSNVDLSLKPGEFISLIGPSGCGKSTLLKIIAGLVQPTSGSISINGATVTGPSRNCGLMFQRPVLLPWRSVLNNVLFPANARGLRSGNYRTKARELLTLVGLKGFEDHYPSQLSIGMQQRVSLCRALLFDEPVLLMDEPFAALDSLSREKADVDLSRITTSSGATVVFVTHSIQEAVLVSDRVIVMSARPARVVQEFAWPVARPRSLAIQEDPYFGQLVGKIRKALEEGALSHD